MKLIFLDTNVIVDFILERDGAENAANILQLGEDRKIELAVSFLTMANIAYIARKGHTQEQLYSIMSDLSAMFKTLPMDDYNKPWNKQLRILKTCYNTNAPRLIFVTSSLLGTKNILPFPNFPS